MRAKWFLLLLAAVLAALVVQHHQALLHLGPLWLSAQPLDLPALEHLSELPFLGHSFQEHKVQLLLERKQWTQALNECRCIESMPAQAALRLLPLRAVAECATMQFRKCEQTMRQVKESAPEQLVRIRSLWAVLKSGQQGRKEREARLESEQIANY